MIQALRDEIIVKPLYRKQEGSIIIPLTAVKYKQYDGDVVGEVISVGSKHKLGTQVGDKIIFQRHEGKNIWVDNEKYLVLKERWVMGVVS